MERRPATAADYETIFEIHAEAFRRHIELIWGSWDDAWQRSNSLRESSESTTEMLMLDEACVGFVQYLVSSARMTIVNVALRRDWQGRGLGTQLFSELKEQAQGRGVEISLRVFPTNDGAYRFYMRLGFQETSRGPTAIELSWTPVSEGEFKTRSGTLA